MLGKDGSTFIESLFAFEIFISVLIILLSVLSVLYKHESKLNAYYENILQREGDLSKETEFNTIIEMVLH